jgi:hypothetical protein
MSREVLECYISYEELSLLCVREPAGLKHTLSWPLLVPFSSRLGAIVELESGRVQYAYALKSAATLS